MLNRTNNKKGAALTAVVMILVVMMVLILPLLASSLAGTNQTMRSEKTVQAQYVARIGAQSVARAILEDQSYTNITDILSMPVFAGSVNNDTYSVIVEDVNNDMRVLRIQSTGAVGDVSETVFLTLSKGGNFFQYAIFGDIMLGLGGSNNTTIIGGDVGTNASSHTGNVTFIPSDNSVQYNQEFDLDPINTQIYLDNEATFMNRIDSSMNIILADEPAYTTNENGHPVVLMRVQDLILSGNSSVVVTGPGELHLLIENSFTMNGNTSFLADSTPDTWVYIDYNSTATMDINGHININGYIYSPNATVRVNGGVGSVIGSLTAKAIDIRGGNFSVTYVAELNDDTIDLSYRPFAWSN